MHGTPSSSTPRGTPSRRGKSPRFSSDSLTSGSLPTNSTNKPTMTIISSLHIPVQGAIPIDVDNQKNSASIESVSLDSKRAPRKSKTDALAALNNQARSSSVGPEEMDISEDLTDKYRNAPPIPVPIHLDLKTVKRRSTRPMKGGSRDPRPFGLTDCPEFFPTTEEFKDPMAYIKSISSIAQVYGICKIIPPEEWNMPFLTDTENFRFKTRLQRLNSIEASSRAKLNFLEQLYQFHKQQGNPRVVVPTINHKPLDLWLLRKEVHLLGGYDAVTKGKKWSDLGRILGYRGIPGLSTQIKNSYTRVILPFEHFCERARSNSALSPLTARDAHLKTHMDIQNTVKIPRTSVAAEETSTPTSPLTSSSSPLSEPPDDSESKDANSKSSRLRRSTRMGSQEQSPKKIGSGTFFPSPVTPPVFYDKDKPDMKIGTPEQNCEICHKKNRGEEMLLCDGCDCGFHTFCLDPPIDTIPKDQWFCFTCLSGTGGDFGFDEGEEHSLSSFQARDKEFRRIWFESHPPLNSDSPLDDGDLMKTRIGNVTVSEYDVEEEFWRLVQSPHETVEIEYGADVHSTTHGSAMPTMETNPLNPYAKDPWNLNNIPILPDSLLRYIKSDISGMTVPWTYVGMAFSTFCWHNEDHYTYSINYMHWGETKTWYGIPGSDAEKFEAAIKCEAPDLFEAQPDLLFQLVTLMNPQRVKDAGVQVFACNQRAGEFVITFPKAYHAGFNHGLNFNEAVNFALPDWLPLGRECVQRYQEHRKLPVFSHDELLITITQQSQSIKTAIWLLDSLKEMTEREMNDRKKARSLKFGEILEEEDRTEDQYQCHICKAFCYLSQVTCQCSTKVVCIDHADLLCNNRSSHHLTLRKRFSDEDLVETYTKFLERASVPYTWRNKLSKLLSESARPPLRSLRALQAEGDRINFPLPEMASLRKCVNKANEWIESANSFTIRKQSRKRSRKAKGRASGTETITNAPDDPGDRLDRGLDDLYGLLREVETLGFDCQEIGQLRNLAQQAEDTKGKAVALLNTEDQERSDFLQDCRRLLAHGSSINVLLDELTEVEKIVDREQLVSELEGKLDDDDGSVTMEEVRQFLTRARICGLPSNNKYMEILNSRQREGNDWEARARNVLEQPIKTIEELNEFSNMDPNIPIDQNVLTPLMTARAKAIDFEKQAKAWLACDPNGSSKARLPDVMRLAGRASKDFSIYSVSLLKRSADIAVDLETRCDNVLRNRYPAANDEDVFQAIAKWKVYAQEHLKMFLLPTFEKLENQLKEHEEWVKLIPWYCSEHNQTHSHAVVQDVFDNTRVDDDDAPTDEFYTCICNQPVRPPPNGAQSDAVQCDHCFARFHGDCAKNGGSCPFCDHHHWNGAIHKERSFHFCFLPTILGKAPEISKNYSEDYKQLEMIVRCVDRLSAVIGQFLSYTSIAENQRTSYIPQVRHFMRKLYKIQFAVSPNPDISFGLDLAGLHRILAGRPPVSRLKKRKRPRFTFGPDVDPEWKDGSRCICRGKNGFVLNSPAIQCESCNRRYHLHCVMYPANERPVQPSDRFICPVCSLRKGKMYLFADIRVVPPGNHPLEIFVNTKEMLDTFSQILILKKMPQAHVQTLYIELMNFQPGSDGNFSSPSPSNAPPPPPRPAVPQQHMFSHHHTPSVPNGTVTPFAAGPQTSHISAMQAGMTTFSAVPTTNTYAPPPPPWSRWGTVSTPAMPPSTQRRTVTGNGDASRPHNGGTPQPQPSSSRKRKIEDISEQYPEQQQHMHHHSPHKIDEDMRPNSSAFPLKRHAGPLLTPTPLSPPRPVQTLSPSLAMIVSPTNQAVHTSPRGSQLAPLRTGSGGSPVLPPVKSLISGEPRPM